MADQVAVLESIRDVLSGKGAPKAEPAKKAEPSAEDEEILDLTKMLNDDGSVTDLAEATPEVIILENIDEPTETKDNKEEDMGETSTTKGDDVLDEIDKLLADDGEAEKSDEIDPNDLDAMFDSPAFEKPAEAEPAQAKAPEAPLTEAAPETEEPVESITDDSVELELAEETKKNEEAMTKETETPVAAPEENLISDAAADKAKSAISDLLKVTGKNEKPAKESTPSPSFRNGDTVEDLVMESLKPMLAKWLDENLSSLVEEIVQKEISKIIPK